MSSPPGEADEAVEAGREALERHAWQEAYEVLAGADEAGRLSGDGLRMLSEAAWWAGQPETVTEVAERAYGAYLEEGDRARAAMMAFELARQYATRLAGPMAASWFAQAERLVADEPDAPVHGYLAWMRGFMASTMQGDSDTALANLDEALAIAGRTGDRNLWAMSLHDKGRTLAWKGNFAEGSALMDEAMVAAVGGELDPFYTGIVYCSMIGACSQIGDYQRAAEWTESTTRWCERHAISGFPGICRVHRAEIKRLRGDWPVAEEEARRACDELPRFNFHYGLGFAFYEIGEVRRRMGDFAGAEDAYGRAHEYGNDPQPGLSLLRLAQGRLDAAAAGIRRALADDTKKGVLRVKSLAAQAEIALATGDPDAAAAAADELDTIAGEFETTALRATVARVRGEALLAGADAAAALPLLRRALHGWQEIDAPYEAAEVRILLGRAYRQLGDDEGALLELRAARETYERLGAAWDAERTAELLSGLATPGDVAERIRRAFVFTDIVRSTDLIVAIGDEAWENLLAWHDQALRSIFALHGGEVVHPTGDGFFVSFGDTDAALRCAVAVQRALVEHRRQHGFAPLVRIGVHTAEAVRRGQDYHGSEVHKAARIAAEARGGQILASEDTIAGTDSEFTVSPPREVSLQGIAGPVRVVSVEWQPSGAG